MINEAKVLFNLSMAGIVPIDESGAINVPEKKLVIGFDWEFFKSLTVFDAEFDIAGFGFGQDFF